MSATEANGWRIFGPNVRGRQCGGCKACCIQVPVQLDEGHKPAGVRCPHLRSKGCGIYPRRPRPCVAWSCKWLFDAAAGMRRPDLAGYIIDPMLDTIMVDETAVDVIQVWCDPARRDAHRDPALRDYLALMHAQFGLLCIVRWNSAEGMVLVPPAAAKDGDWQEHGDAMMNTLEEMRERLAKVGAVSVYDGALGVVKP
jgi:Pyruvate/2-oxoacid:ferredoxin oxidoreductase delta subunit